MFIIVHDLKGSLGIEKIPAARFEVVFEVVLLPEAYTPVGGIGWEYRIASLRLNQGERSKILVGQVLRDLLIDLGS